MEISKINYYINDLSSNKTIEIPKACPNCGIGNNPTTSNISSMDTKEGKVIGLFHRCTACQKSHMTLQEYQTGNGYTTMAIVYPNKVITDIDPLFIEHAPRFVEFYSEAMEAEKLGLENIAGAGYRSAIECLIKDYALDFELDSKEEIAKLNFNNAIDKYIKDDELLNGSIHVIRKIGNSYTHWDKSLDISLGVLKSYVEITLQIFKAKLMMKYRPV